MLSWLAQANWQPGEPPRNRFEVLVRHFYARLLSSATLAEGDEASVSQIAQLAYAAALPTLLFALYLFPAYHQLGHKPPFWAQVGHHFFFVDASFALMGIATLLHWDLLFPDRLDALILTPLPVKARGAIAAKAVALLWLLGGLLIATSCLGIVFFPMLAELPHLFFRQFAAHAIAVLAAGLCAACAVIALRSIVICCCGQRLTQMLEPILQTGCVLACAMVLLLEPMISRLIPDLLTSPSGVAFWFPPFWFVGLYEEVLLGKSAGPAFATLANIALVAMALLLSTVLVTYPLAYARKTRQAIEGAVVVRQFSFGSKSYASMFPRLVLRESQSLATFHWVRLTLWRAPRTRLVLTLFAALILTFPAMEWMMTLEPRILERSALLLEVARLAIPATAVLTIIALRIAMRAPVAKAGSWVFQVIQGRPDDRHFAGVYTWVSFCSCISTLVVLVMMFLLLPVPLRGGMGVITQLGLAVILPILGTDLLLLRETTIPFTHQRTKSVDDLSLSMSSFFVLLPVLAYALVAVEPWMEQKWLHNAGVVAAALMVHRYMLIGKARSQELSVRDSDMEGDDLLPGELGLRDQASS